MSSFVLLTKHGPPDLIVEVGTPIFQGPIMLSGLFQAIVSFTDEVAQDPLQVLQTKGFTVQFKPMFDDYILIVGTNHTIIGLDMVLEQIGEIMIDGFRNNVDLTLIEQTITDVLHNYVEFATVGDQLIEEGDRISQELQDMFAGIPGQIYEILFFGLLAGYRLRYPKTNSMDLNRNLLKFIEFIGQSCCSDLDSECFDTLTFTSSKGDFLLRDQPVNRKDMVTRTNLLKELLKLADQGKFEELKIKLVSELGTLSQLENVFLDFDYTTPSDDEQHKIDDLRYILGHELEYYLLLRLQRRDQELVKYLQANTKQTEWMSNW